MKDGVVQLEGIDAALPAALRAGLDERRAALMSGRRQPFAAPLADQQGKQRLAAGALDDGAIATMNWFVQGVVGQLP
jgi:simple sugar transport system substrate-binding protein